MHIKAVMLLMCLKMSEEGFFCFPVRDCEGGCSKLLSLVKLYQRFWIWDIDQNLKILQNSQENTRVSFLIKLQVSGLRHAALLKNNFVWSGITNSIAFCVWFFQKKYFWSNIIARLPFPLEIFVNMCCNCLLTRLWRHKFWS